MKLQAKKQIEKATPEYILSVIRDSYRQACNYDPEVESGYELTFETTIEEWREVSDLIPWRGLSKALAAWFSVDMTDNEWKALLEPAEERYLGELCEAIANKAERIEIAPVNIFGRTCMAASIFFAIKGMLAEAGADVSRLNPETELHYFTRGYPSVFIEGLGVIFPNKLPPVRISKPLYDAAMFSVLIGTIAALLCIVIKNPLFRTCSVTFLLIAYLSTWITARMKPNSVTFGDIRTFRDLVTLLVREADTEQHAVAVKPQSA